MAHLLVAVTAHGYGHLAQVAPVIHALRHRVPDLQITLQGELNPEFVHYRLPVGVEIIQQAADVALPMDSPLDVRWSEGLELYQTFEADYPAQLQRQLELLGKARPDLVVADVPWLPLDAARRLGIPAVAVCSLNWLDILLQSPVSTLVPTALAQRLRGAYENAELFICPTPSMPMPWLSNRRVVGPIAEVRKRNPHELRHRLGVTDDRRLVVMQFGGTGSLRLEPEPLRQARVQILTADPAIPENPAVSRIGGPGLGMLEVLASCDAMITKPGYGSFAEAACHGIPMLYVPRDRWPETPALVEWIQHQVPTATISPQQLAAGDIAPSLEALLKQAPKSTTPHPPTGIEQTVELLSSWLR